MGAFSLIVVINLLNSCGNEMENLLFRPLNCKSEDELEQTKFIFDSYWPQADRLSWLKRSNERFPLSFVLLNPVCVSVVGHVRLCMIADREDSVYIESVIVASNHRGKGYGSHLMKLTESECNKRGFKEAFLATSDKEAFYAHIGSSVTEENYQVLHSPNDSIVALKMKLLLNSSSKSENICSNRDMSKTNDKNPQPEMINCVDVPKAPCPPPLPAPVVPRQQQLPFKRSKVPSTQHSANNDKLISMKKAL